MEYTALGRSSPRHTSVHRLPMYFVEILSLMLPCPGSQPSSLACCSTPQTQPYLLQAWVCLAVGPLEGAVSSVVYVSGGCFSCLCWMWSGSVPICEVGSNPVHSGNPIFVVCFQSDEVSQCHSRLKTMTREMLE